MATSLIGHLLLVSNALFRLCYPKRCTTIVVAMTVIVGRATWMVVTSVLVKVTVIPDIGVLVIHAHVLSAC